MSGWSDIQAEDLTPRHIGRLVRLGAGGPFRRLRYFRASEPVPGLVAVTIRLESQRPNMTSYSLPSDALLQVIDRDEFSAGRELVAEQTDVDLARMDPGREVRDRTGRVWTRGPWGLWKHPGMDQEEPLEGISSRQLCLRYGPITD